VRPTSLEGLLAEGEFLTSQLVQIRPSAAQMSPGWPLLAGAGQRLLTECLGPRLPSDPVDVVLAAAADALGGMRHHGVAKSAPPDGARTQLVRVADLLAAAADLLATTPSLHAEQARAVGARAAAVLAAVAHVTVVADRTGARDLAFRAMRVEQMTSRVVDAQLGQGRGWYLDEIVAAPGCDTGAETAVGTRYQAAALAWRRIAARDVAPSSVTLDQGAISIARATADLWHALGGAARTGLVDVAAAARCEQDLRQAADAWRSVHEAWAAITSAVPASLGERMAAVELAQAARSLRTALADPELDQGGAAELGAAARRGHAHLAELGIQHLELTRRLATHGQLYVDARDLPLTADRVEAVIHRRHIPAPTQRCHELLDSYTVSAGHSAAVRRTIHDLLLPVRSPADQPPQLQQLTILAHRPAPSRR
jgi:hypothetical protein